MSVSGQYEYVIMNFTWKPVLESSIHYHRGTLRPFYPSVIDKIREYRDEKVLLSSYQLRNVSSLLPKLYLYFWGKRHETTSFLVLEKITHEKPPAVSCISTDVSRWISRVLSNHHLKEHWEWVNFVFVCVTNFVAIWTSEIKEIWPSYMKPVPQTMRGQH